MYFVALLLTLRLPPAVASLTYRERYCLCEAVVGVLTQPRGPDLPAFIRVSLFSHEGPRATLRIALGEPWGADEPISVLQALLSLSSVPAGRQECTVESVDLADSAWTGIRTWDDIAHGRRGSLMRFAFATPLAMVGPERERIRGAGPFPDPELLFSALRRHWSELGGPTLPPDVEQMVRASGCVVSNYRLYTVSFERGDQNWTGYRGWIEYECRRRNSASVESLNALARLAFFTGLGGRTEQGMGSAAVTILY
jgi:CRISPR-associated endoribonuclease Cas6